jgi:hypothetical protein
MSSLDRPRRAEVIMVKQKIQDISYCIVRHSRRSQCQSEIFFRMAWNLETGNAEKISIIDRNTT